MSVKFHHLIESGAQEKVLEALSRLNIGGAKVVEASLVYGDLSPRRYFRAHFDREVDISGLSGRIIPAQSTLIIMYFDSVNPPEAETKQVRTSFSAYQELSDYFVKHGYPVPEVFAYEPDLSIILQEDLGSTPFITLAESASPDVPRLYLEAVSNIHRMQAMNPELCFAFERGFDERVYLNEMKECSDFFFPDFAEEEEIVEAVKCFKSLAREIATFPKVLVHRDYHSWNLMRDQQGSLRVIDFQDALLGTRPYDLVALVHERDIDQVLGERLVKDLEDAFFKGFSDPGVREYEYPRVMLQRDMKVVGRFAKVVKTRGLTAYGRWIPGTTRRILNTLENLSSENSGFSVLSGLFSRSIKSSPFIKSDLVK